MLRWEGFIELVCLRVCLYHVCVCVCVCVLEWNVVSRV